jgi:hypothetical protein
MMSNILLYLNDILKDYPIESIIAIISFLANIFIFINKHLPVNFQIDKRYSFLRRVKNTICNISVSIRCNRKFKSSEIKGKISKLLNQSFKLKNDENGLFIFESLTTNLNYSLKVGESNNENEQTIIIEVSNAFKTTRLGNIKGIDKSLEELQKIINLFSGDKKDTENVNSQIKIFPNDNFKDKEESLEIKIEDKHYFISCTKAIISIKSKGIPDSKKMIHKGLNIWMKYFI